jgi:hypothetical protein
MRALWSGLFAFKSEKRKCECERENESIMVTKKIIKKKK